MNRRGRKPKASVLFDFDAQHAERGPWIAGVDEAGRGPLAGPVVAAAVMISPCAIPILGDSKLLTSEQRFEAYRFIQRHAHAVGVGIVFHDVIDRINIRQASFVAMRQALEQLVIRPDHVLVDGFPIPLSEYSQTAVIRGDAKSACIAAASIVAKVTRDCIMDALDREYPGYGFRQHKGYGTPEHLDTLRRLGPCQIHRTTFRPVTLSCSTSN